MKNDCALVWFRRDLRLSDNRALEKANIESDKIFTLFVYDEIILQALQDRNDQRLSFIADGLMDLDQQLQACGGGLMIAFGNPKDIVPKIAHKLAVKKVYCNKDFESYAKERDQSVRESLRALAIDFETTLDHVILDPDSLRTQQGKVYTVFTPFKKKWLEVYDQTGKVVQAKAKNLNYLYPSSELAKNLQISSDPIGVLQKHGFNYGKPVCAGGELEAQKRLVEFSNPIKKYDQTRDQLGYEGTSGLSPYLRHGNLSAREAYSFAQKKNSLGARVWQSELIWREFYQYLLNYFPSFGDSSFVPKYNKKKWPGDKKHFELWQQGQTGFPVVDASMRCLLQTGTMPNRARMIVASFLCKLLLIDWQKGERHFARYLLDFDLAANAGGWQWCASTGADPVPYFRIFNPYLQSQKFDSQGLFIKRFVPELAQLPVKYLHRPELAPKEVLNQARVSLGSSYPRAIVNYEEARARALDWYTQVNKQQL